MSEIETVPTKYIFLDIVSFTHKRSIEAQSDLVAALNSIVETSIKFLQVPKDKIIFLPTGDGMCICLLNIEQPYDIHILLALQVLAELQEWNAKTSDQMRRFEVRIGVNANTDNLVTDINGRKNLAGAGINIAQRVMSVAENSQIFLGPVVCETLKEREKYMNNLRPYFVSVKHGATLQVSQLVASGHKGLNIEVPSQFIQKKPTEPKEPKLTKFVAYYIAHALRLQGFLSKITGDHHNATVAAIVLWILADDSTDEAERSEFEKPSGRLWNRGKATIEQQFEHYRACDWVVCDQFSTFLTEWLEPYADCFRDDGIFFDIHFITDKGRQKLRAEHPGIWKQFKLDEQPN
jgi:hypothetical protein